MTIKEMRKLSRDGHLTPWLVEESPEDYINKMKKSGVYVDALFLRVMACVLQSDIVLLHLHKHTVNNTVYTWLKGGSFLSETSGQKCPLFLGNVLHT